MQASRVSNERGMALAVAIFALVVIGALVAGTFFAGRLEQQSGQNTFYASQAAEAAEAAIAQSLGGSLSSATMLALATNGGTTTLSSVSLGGHVVGTPSLTRLTSSVWLLKGVGERQNVAGTMVARRTLGQLVRLNQAAVKVNAGLTAIGKVTVSGNSTVSGNDVTPSQWADVDCPPLDSVAGVLYNGQVTQQGSAVITGDPNRQQDNTLTAANMLGGSSFAQLKAMATLILTGNVSGLAAATTGNPPVCNASVQSNWGAPTDTASACFDYFPIIYHLGDLQISGSGEGQGILLVEGNLNVQGRIDFYGPVIVTGGVNIRGTGSDDVKFYGGVMAQDVTLDDSKLTGNAEVNYSSCAIRRALQGSAKPIPLTERTWVQLYDE
jgi:Tfp pilus assembly protein PilX